MRGARAAQRNIVTEMAGADAEGMVALPDALEIAGYRAEVIQVTCDREVTWQRNLERDDNISSYYTEPYHLDWLLEALRQR